MHLHAGETEHSDFSRLVSNFLKLNFFGHLGPQEETAGASNQILGQSEGWYLDLVKTCDRSWGNISKMSRV